MGIAERILSGEAAAPPSVTPRARMRLRNLAIAGAALLLAVGAAHAGYRYWTVGRFIASTDDAYVGGDVTVIAPEVPGFIARVAVVDNQPVRAGDLLIKLDDRDYRAALARAQSIVDAQHAALANLNAQQHLQEAVVAQAAAGIDGADAEIQRSRYDQSRYQALARVAASSVQEWQHADAAYREAVAAGVKARAAYTAALRQMDVIETQKAQARAALAQAEAELHTAQLNLGYTELHAPVDGVVGNRSARLGAYTVAGAQLISLVPAHGLWVDANFKESQLAQLHPGQKAVIQADVLPGQIFHGHVASLAPATGAEFSVLPPENATGNFTKIVQRVPVRIRLDSDAAELGRLRPGLSVTAEVDQRDAVP